MNRPNQFDVYQLSQSFAADVFRLCGTFPRGTGSLRNQIRRSSQAVVLNLAEGLGRWKAGEKRAAYAIARGELLETRAGLDLALRCGLCDDETHRRLDTMGDRVSAMLWRLVQRFRE